MIVVGALANLGLESLAYLLLSTLVTSMLDSWNAVSGKPENNIMFVSS
jgi:hypothetical protein